MSTPLFLGRGGAPPPQRPPAAALALALFAGLPASLAGCAPEGCLQGEDGCIVPSPCEQLEFTCAAGASEVYVLAPGDTFPTENDTLAAAGDIVLANEQVVAVIEAIDHPHYLSPTGGGIIDLYARGAANDSMRHFFQVTGVLPGDSFRYESVELLDEGSVKAVQLLGTLYGYPDVRVATRYEVRPCEPGVRVRTEIMNESPDALSWFHTDALYFGDRGNLPFVPGKGLGFQWPSFGLSTLLDGFVDVPYLATNSYSGGAASYAVVACSEEAVSGFHSVQVSAAGMSPRIVMPRDYTVYERFLGLGDGTSVSGGVDVALELRRQLFGEPYVELSGKVVAEGGTIGDGARVSLLVAEGTAETAVEERTPVTHVIPGPDGRWTARVPADRDYVIAAEAFGMPVGELEVRVGAGATDAGTLTVEPSGEVTIDATIDGEADHLLVFVVPADDATEAAVTGEMFGHFGACAPLLGNPHGPSPACNRVLVEGPTTVAMPAGTYDFYTVAGPFSTMAAVRGVTVEPSTGQSVLLELESLDLQPAGTLSGDFHVHGGASFDASIPDTDRVKAMLASRIEVVATTEHDTVWDYSEAAAALGASDRLELVSGTESTGHFLFQLRTDFGFPQVTGHWNFWPVTLDPEGPYRGASWDELAEPGGLFTRQRDEGNFDAAIGVIQLNHPLGGYTFGRDYGWISATGMDLDEPPQEDFDGTGQSLFLHTPEGADYSNADFDTQEVMNGTKNELVLAYRAFWFYLLDHGFVRAGTANSDSHTLTENVMGTPRTLVYTDTTLADFDLAAFNQAVREGRSTGTNGPVIEAVVTSAGATTGPSVYPFAPGAAATLDIVVRAAPWVPVTEVRIVVNGEVARTITELSTPTDPFGTEGLDRLATSVPLADLLPASGDAWIVVEAGTALAENADLNCDGAPDTGDNDGDGVIDANDVDTDGDGDVDADDAASPPLPDEEGCLDTVGPMGEPPAPERGTAEWFFRQVTPPGGYPMSFTNPFLVDGDGDGEFTGVRQ